MPNITGVSAPVLGNDKNTYSTKIEDSFDAIDAHDHTSGKGVQIPTAGIADLAVTTAKVNDGAVTAAKLASDAVTTAKILDAQVTAAKLASDAVTTAKILDGNVTKAKLAALGQQISSSSGSFSTTSATPVDVTNLSVSLTTTGRPVMILLIPDGSAATAYVGCTQGGVTATLGGLLLKRDSTTIANWVLSVAGASGNLGLELPPGAISFVDVPAAGTYTYKFQAGTDGVASVYVSTCKMVAFEL